MTKSEAGRLGGLARTDRKRRALELNCAKARSVKALYRLHPASRPSQTLTADQILKWGAPSDPKE